MSSGKHKALALLTQALDQWEVDPDEDGADEQEAWANVLDAANLLAKLTGEPEPG